MRRIAAMIVLAGLILLVVIDATFHFDKKRVSTKREHQSAQRHWSLFYPQKFTYTDSSFKYLPDIQDIRELLEPNTIVLTDKATSYYLSAELPLFVKNVHDHHNRNSEWFSASSQSRYCYIDHQEIYAEVHSFILDQNNQSIESNDLEFKYWIINRDTSNLNLRYDCLATRATDIAVGLDKLGRLIYNGEFLSLYELN